MTLGTVVLVWTEETPENISDIESVAVQYF
jgi:hypothetical protein